MTPTALRRLRLALAMALCAACAAPTVSAQSAVPQKGMVYRTAYTWYDNTPPGSAAIARPAVHKVAGGVGTWDDPVTVAVGHSIEAGVQTWDVPAGTRLYFPDMARYGVVEDVCGDGPRPQDGPCHSGFRGHMWVDIWVDGRTLSASQATACAERVTGVVEVVWHPPSDLPVTPGVLADTFCD